MVLASRFIAPVIGLARVGLDLVFPPRCPCGKAYVSAEGNFCAACFAQLKMISDPLCDCCGIPFVVKVEEGALCPACLENRPTFSKARSVMVYDAVSAPLISALKFHDQWSGVERYATMMTAAGHALLKGADYLIPVPLHWRRLWWRKFNQSALLAYGMHVRTAIPWLPEGLQRVRYTPPQRRLDRKTRLSNVKRAFAVHSRHINQLKDKVIVVVDDVVTTGATANACAEILLAAGAREVRIVSLARTVKE